MAFTYQVRSDKDTHFTGAIIQNAAEEENIVLPQCLRGMNGNARAIVRSVAIVSDENLDWEVWLFRTDGFQDADLDLDTFTGFMAFAVADARQIAGAGPFYYYRGELNLPYQDADNTGELHIALVNRSAAAKSAGAAGEAVVILEMEPAEPS
jgi:hypothetical protein